MNYNTVIFDLFGTLVDDFVSSAGQMNTHMAAALEVPHEQFMQVWRETSDLRTIGAFQTVEASIDYVCSKIGATLTAEQMATAVEIRLRHTRHALKPRPNTLATLEELRKRGYRIGLISNCSIEIPILWPETTFADLVESPIFSSRVNLRKPDVRIYHLACERLSVLPEQCVYIADGENHELAVAADLGLHPVLIRNSTSQHRLELFREATEWQGDVVSTIPELLSLVFK
jgi:putative hydrolase of the HAD superfamily